MSLSEGEWFKRLRRVQDLFEHAKSECADPDCEIHNPWMQEDEVDKYLACAYFIAGTKWAQGFITTQLNDAQESIREDMRTLLEAPERMEEL